MSPALLKHAREHGVLAGFSNQLSFDPREFADAEMRRAGAGGGGAGDRCFGCGADCNAACWPRPRTGPPTPDADEVLDQRRDEIFVVPDVLCNAGGVVVSYFEWVQDLQQFFWDEAR